MTRKSHHSANDKHRWRRLYELAFAEFGTSALWNLRQLKDPTPRDALLTARQLRVEGDLDARRLAEQLEKSAARSPDSYIGGTLPINRRRGPRTSKDIDIFHAREEDVSIAAEKDSELLRKAGYTIKWLRRQPGIHSAEIIGPGGSTRLEWVADADYRFFPATADPQFGYVLHPVDLAVNKLIAAANRREPRDIVDLVTIHQNYLPLGAMALAAAGVVGGFTPEGLLDEVSRNSRYAPDDFRGLSSEVPIDPDVVLRSLREALEQAREFVARMPTAEVGIIFLKEGVPVQPDPNNLTAYVRHRPQRKGHWPTTPGITSSMLAKLQNVWRQEV